LKGRKAPRPWIARVGRCPAGSSLIPSAKVGHVLVLDVRGQWTDGEHADVVQVDRMLAQRAPPARPLRSATGVWHE
jgi:hypothetical protein